MFRKLTEKLNDTILERFMNHIGRLGNVGIMFGCAVSLIKFREKFFTEEPAIGIYLGIFTLGLAYIALIFVAIGIVKEIHASISRKWASEVVGILAFFYIILLGFGIVGSVI